MKKQIGHLAVVSLKFFFDFDPSLSNHILFTGIIILGICKLFISNISSALQDGMLTVKADILTLREEVATLKERWEESQLRRVLANNTRMRNWN